MIIIPTVIVVLLACTDVKPIKLYNLNVGGSLYQLPFNKIVKLTKIATNLFINCYQQIVTNTIYCNKEKRGLGREIKDMGGLSVFHVEFFCKSKTSLLIF